MRIPKSIFRDYDIRGVYPAELNEDTSEMIGKALGTYLLTGRIASLVGVDGCSVVVGRDNRDSSLPISKSFIDGLLSTGCDVTDVSESATPIIHFLTNVHDFDAGVVITASHNPKQYNGFRVDLSKSEPLYGGKLAALFDICVGGKFETGSGMLTKKDLSVDYFAYLKRAFRFSKGLKIVIDCGGGAISKFGPSLFEELGCKVSEMSCVSDGTYPRGVPNPEDRGFMRPLRARVVAEHADLGVAFDTDDDRFGVVDAKGNMYENDKLLLLFSDILLRSTRGATVVFDVKCSLLLEELISSWGGVPKMIRTGHPYFIEAIKRGALLGGEYSGHMFFGGEYFGYDDGIYAACKVIDLVAKEGRSLFELMREYPKRYHTSEVKVSCSDGVKYGLVDSLTYKLNGKRDFVSVANVDGVRVRMSNTGWFLIRASNTSPYLSVRAEGVDDREARLMLGCVKDLLSGYEGVDAAILDRTEVYAS